jgi:hypothetical protein
MKPLLPILTLVFFSYSLHSQTVTIPDATFKSILTSTNCVDTNGDSFYDSDVDTNNDGEIQVSEALEVVSLYANDNINSFEGLESFTNLEVFIGGNYSGQPVDYLNVSTLSNLREFKFGLYEVSSSVIDLTQNYNLEKVETFFGRLYLGEAPNLHTLDAQNTVVAEQDFTTYNNLITLRLDYCSVWQHVDLSQSPNLINIDLSVSSFPSINIKNGRLDYDILGFQHSTFTYACVDDFELEETEAYATGMFLGFGFEIEVNTYCSFIPGGTSYVVQGYNVFDANGNGCDPSDAAYPNLKFNINNGTNSTTYMADSDGNFQYYTLEGITTMTPILENPNYFSVIPNSAAIDFSTEASPFTQVFCIAPNGTHNDLEVVLIPIGIARPGFDSTYKIIYKNNGTTTLNGTVELNFNDNVIDFIDATPSIDTQLEGSLNWNFINLNPLESREVFYSMNLNTPTETPSLNDGDSLSFTASVFSSENDETPFNNVMTINQNVVNAYDPNDKICLEGGMVSTDQIGKEIHYVVRFENTGSTNASNVVVKDIIDTTKFDISTLVLVDASHSVVPRILNTNAVEFIFENINLPFDDANNDGYVVFKIKTLNTLVAGDSFENDAEIYFDFNYPIITNNAVTTIETLGITDYNLSQLNVSPNPAKDIINIETINNIKSITIYDNLGRTINILSLLGSKNKVTIDSNDLISGIYFLKIITDSGQGIRKIIKE